MIKTEHILFINSNTRYERSKGDGAEFEAAISKLNEFGRGTFQFFDESVSMKDYIVGMYPEFEKALDYFHEEFYKYPDGAKNDALMGAKAKVTINKFGLNKEYDFDCEPNKEQLRRLNERIKPKQKNDAAKYAPGFLKHIAFAVIDACDDCRRANLFLRNINVISGVLSGRYPEDFVRKYQENNDGAKEGLKFLSLKKEGLIDDRLEITDIDKFCDSKIIKEFSVGGKVYDLSEKLRELYGRPSNKVIRNYSKGEEKCAGS
ncbi:MAG: hypothetical protein IKO06_01285 [Alphaproteobacteria bacterium]|nr:hypothetical protein [Alphaproteobacteria bacterium]